MIKCPNKTTTQGRKGFIVACDSRLQSAVTGKSRNGELEATGDLKPLVTCSQSRENKCTRSRSRSRTPASGTLPPVTFRLGPPTSTSRQGILQSQPNPYSSSVRLYMYGVDNLNKPHPGHGALTCNPVTIGEAQEFKPQGHPTLHIQLYASQPCTESLS